MPIFSSEPATTVRQHSSWLLSKPVYAAIFAAVALSAYGWKLISSRPEKAEAPAQATAQVCIHCPNYAFQGAGEEILARAKPEVCENLLIEGRAAGQETWVRISLSRLPAETLVPLVNAMASAYSQTCRAQWKLQHEQSFSAAQETVRQTQCRALEAQMQFELLRDRRLRSRADIRTAAVPQPATMENPRWKEVCRRLADLEDRKTNLLLDRTPLHPSVVEVETRIAAVRGEMASIPPRLVQDPPAAPQVKAVPGDRPEAAEVAAAQRTAEQLSQDLQKSQAIERAARAARDMELQIDLLAAEPPPPPLSPPRAGSLLGNAFATATTSIVGLGMICHGVALEPVLTSVAELQSLLPAAVVGVIPATHLGRRRPSELRRRVARWGWMTAGLAVLLACAWLFLLG